MGGAGEVGGGGEVGGAGEVGGGGVVAGGGGGEAVTRVVAGGPDEGGGVVDGVTAPVGGATMADGVCTGGRPTESARTTSVFAARSPMRRWSLLASSAPPTIGAKYGKASTTQSTPRRMFAPRPAFSNVSAVTTRMPVRSFPGLQPVMPGRIMVEMSTQASQIRVIAKTSFAVPTYRVVSAWRQRSSLRLLITSHWSSAVTESSNCVLVNVAEAYARIIAAPISPSIRKAPMRRPTTAVGFDNEGLGGGGDMDCTALSVAHGGGPRR